jgi:hypothetical protein
MELSMRDKVKYLEYYGKNRPWRVLVGFWDAKFAEKLPCSMETLKGGNQVTQIQIRLEMELRLRNEVKFLEFY